MESPLINPKVAIYSFSLVTLFLVLLVIKLMKLVDWSWWVITAPLWVPPIGLVIILLYIVLASYLKDPSDFYQRDS